MWLTEIDKHVPSQSILCVLPSSYTNRYFVESMNIEIIFAFLRIILLVGVITLIVLITTKTSKRKNPKSYQKPEESIDLILDWDILSNSNTSTANPKLKTVTYEIGPTSIGRLQKSISFLTMSVSFFINESTFLSDCDVSRIGNMVCEDESNVPECGFDGGDCCLKNGVKMECSVCDCHLNTIPPFDPCKS